MVDFLGQELKIGDDVVYCRHNRTSASFTSLTKTKIIGFTNKMVKIENGSWGNVYPDRLIKITELNITNKK